jgi:hypothetical protein
MMRNKSAFSFSFRLTAIAICIVIGTFFAINIFDSDLKPEVKVITDAKPQKIITENNAYFQLVGLYTSNNDLEKSGLTIFNHANSSTKQTENLLPSIKFIRGDVSNYCFFEIDYLTACNNYIKNQRETIKASINTNSNLLARYQIILDGFEQYIEPTHVQGIYWQRDILPLHRLYLFGLITRPKKISPGNQTWQQLTSNITFWRNILANTYSLTTKMVAVSALKSDYKILFELMYSCSNCKKHISKNVIQPLTQEELDLGAALNYEFLYLVKAIEKESRNTTVKSKISNLFYNHNKIINSIYEMYATYSEAVQYSQLDGPKEAKKTMAKYSLENKLSWAGLFYNPTGKIYAAANVPSTYNYSLRMIQLDQQIAVLRALDNQLSKSSSLKDKQNYLQNSTELISGLNFTVKRFNHGLATRKDVAEFLQHLARMTQDVYFENQYQYWSSDNE